jgi:taurine transport system substrate-binding protein
MKRSVPILLCLSLFVAIVFTSQQATAAGQPEKVSVIYGGSTWLGHYPAWVGIEKGIFKKHGLGVLWQMFYGSSGRMGSMTAGDLDMASTGCIGAIALMSSGVKSFYAVGTQDSYATVEGIIARRGINSIQDLKGKKVAATFASSAHVLILDLLQQNGIDPNDDLTLVNLKVTEMPAAMKSGEIDACAAWTPHFNKILNMPGMKLLVDDTEFSLFKQYNLGPGPDLLVVRREFADKYPNSTAAFWDAFFEAVELIKAQPEECAKVLTKLTNLSMEDQLKVLKDIKWLGKEEQKKLMLEPGNFVQGMQKLAGFLVDQKQLDTAPQVKEWVDKKFVP